MKTIAFNVLALFAGLFIGSLVNIGLVTLGPHVIENPVGVDMSDVDKMRESMKLLQPANFIFPFLAHALGTLAGAAIAARTAASHPMIFAASIAHGSSRSRQVCILAWSVRSNSSGVMVMDRSNSDSTSLCGAVWANFIPSPAAQ